MIDLDSMTCDFLGLSPTNDHRRLLGLPTGHVDATVVNRSLRRRLAQVHVHPQGRTQEADEVRSYLQRIATDMKQGMPQVTSTEEQYGELTPLDQAILAALIGDGGWNRRCRARLVSIAASFTITVGGLMRVLEALAESARSGHGPLSVKQRSTYDMNRQWTSVPVKKTAMSAVEEFVSETAKRFTPDLSAPNPVMTLKLAVLFALLTLFAFILSLKILLSSDNIANNLNTTFVEEVVQSDTMSSQDMDINKIPDPYGTYPTFSATTDNMNSIHAADRAVIVSRDLDQLAITIRNTYLRGSDTQEQWLATWKEASDVVSSGWPHLEDSLLQSISNSMIEVLVQAEQDQKFTDSLLEAIKPSRLRLRNSFVAIQLPWQIGFFSRISNAPRLSVSTQSKARKLQLPSIPIGSEDEARLLALDLIANELIELTEIDDRVFQFWELWIESVSQLSISSNASDRFMRAIATLIDTKVDLSRDSNTRKILGRIVSEVDWSKGDLLLDGLLALYRSKNVSSDDIWVLSQMLRDADSCSWFSDQYLVHPNSTIDERMSLATLVEREWPDDDSPIRAVWNLSLPSGFQPEDVQSWKKRVNSVLSGSLNSQSIVKLRFMNEAAVYIWKGRPALAKKCFDKFDIFEGVDSASTAQQTSPDDGEWSDKYIHYQGDQNLSKVDLRLGALDYLVENEITDLGPRDAKTLSGAALTHLSTKLRNHATEVILSQFRNSKNVAVAILHELPKALTRQQVTKLVANLTEAILPESSNPQWDLAARRALVQHALTVGNQHQKELDLLSNELTSSLIAEALFLDPTTLPPSVEIKASKAHASLVDHWRREVSNYGEPVDNGWFNPVGVLQEYLQYQLQYMKLLKVDEAKWRDRRINQKNLGIIDISGNSGDTIVRQILHVETSIIHHWERLLSELLIEHARRNANE